MRASRPPRKYSDADLIAELRRADAVLNLGGVCHKREHRKGRAA